MKMIAMTSTTTPRTAVNCPEDLTLGALATGVSMPRSKRHTPDGDTREWGRFAASRHRCGRGSVQLADLQRCDVRVGLNRLGYVARRALDRERSCARERHRPGLRRRVRAGVALLHCRVVLDRERLGLR